jgi:DNA gyrase subunit B
MGMESPERGRAQVAARESHFDQASRWVSDGALQAQFVELAACGQHHVVDICCGTGQVGGALAESGAYVVGVDLSPGMLKQAAERLNETVCADAQHLPFSTGSFARLVLCQAWHFFDPALVSCELARIACAGARLVTAQIVPFSDEDAAHVERIHRTQQPDLRWFPTESAIVAALEGSGWQVREKRQLVIVEEMHAWLPGASASGDQTEEVIRLVKQAPAAYRRLHQVREEGDKLYDSFCWKIIVAEKPGQPPALESEVLKLLKCPNCNHHPLTAESAQLRCASCGASYPVDAGVPRLGQASR